jgi:hypothetical protein
VIVKVTWEMDGFPLAVVGESRVMITPPKDDKHADTALKVLSTPDTLLVLALGGDHMKEGIEAIQAALDNKVLRPHFAWIEAKRLGRRFGKRTGSLKSVADLLDPNSVMSPAEKRRLEDLMKGGKGKDSNRFAKEVMQRMI